MYILTILLLLFLNQASNCQQHLLCTAVGDNSSDSSTLELRTNSQTNRDLLLPLGPREELGLKGERGLQGLPGTVDYGQLGDVLDSKIATEFVKVKNKIREMLGYKTGIGSRTGDGCKGDFYYRGRCYSLRLSTEYNVTRRAASLSCKQHGALLAEIHDQANQAAIEKHLRSEMSRYAPTIEIWLGMKFISANSVVRYRTGKEISPHRLEWHSSFPISLEPVTRIALNLKKIKQADQGLWNARRKTRYLRGALCERKY